MCTKEEGVIFEDLTSQLPDYYVCVGQTDLETCKAQIEGIESISNDVTWIWTVRTESISSLKNVKRVYITDKQLLGYTEIEIILTKNAELFYSTDSIVVGQNHIDNIIAQSKSAKLNIVVNGYHEKEEPFSNTDFSIQYESAPTDIDLCIYFYEESVNLFLNLPGDYVPKSIKIQGNSDIYIRKSHINNINIFDGPESITFLENNDPNYNCICYADSIEKCVINDDFLHVTTLEEIINYKVDDYLEVYLYSPITLSMNIEINPALYLFFFEGSSLTIDIPDESRIIMGYSEGFHGIEVVSKSRSQMFYILNENVESIFKIKTSIYLDLLVDGDDIQFIPKIELNTNEKNIEIFPCTDFSSRILKINTNYRIKLNDGVSITSPMPDYLESLFGSTSITFSGICIYLNEEGKSLCGSKQSKSFEEAKLENIETKNIIFTTGIDTTFSIPSIWTNEHFLYFVRPESAKIYLEDTTNLFYYAVGVTVNEKFKIIAGNLIFNSPQELTFNVQLPTGFPIISYMYFCFIDCGKNEQTNFYAGYLSGNQIFRYARCIHVGGYDETHKLTVYFSKEEDLQELYGVALLYGDEKGMNYKFGGYSYICYASSDAVNEKCTQPNYYLVSDISSLINAVGSFPDLTVTVAKNLNIPESTGKSFLLSPFDENIEVTIPPSPKSIQILENNCVQVNYADSTYIKTLNKMNIIIGLKDKIEMSVSGSLQSKITFELHSNVLISTPSKITEKFTINVVKNNYHLYTEDLTSFGTIFGDSLEQYQKICAYAANSESICTYNKKDTIENVFKTPFAYHEIELAISMKNQEIALPSISDNVIINIRTENSATLIVNSVSNVQIADEILKINENWIFKENKEVVSVKLEKESVLSITEQINTPFTIYLTDKDSTIDLRNCISQENKQITIVKTGELQNTITIIGTEESFNNFKSLLVSYEGITINQNNEQKYLCVCKDDSCNKCKQGIEGFITLSDSITSDPGQNTIIRVFMNIEVESNLFTNEHDVFVDSSNTLIISNTQKVYQNIENKLKVDNLVLSKTNNVIIKPKPSTLYITMAKQKAGLDFTIEFTTYLVLNVLNANEEGIVASKINAKGSGELNLYDYPYDKVEAESTIRVIKGVYVICKSKSEGSFCSYKSVDYKIINNYDDFTKEFDENSKILIILDSYTSIIDVNINKLKYQQMIFIRQGFSLRLLETNSKVRILSTNVLTNKADLSMNLDGSQGGVILSNDDSDLFIVAFDDKLTIKQEGDIESTLKTVVIQPQNEKATIVIDDNVNIEKQKIAIEPKNEKLELTVFVGNKPTDNEHYNNFLEVSEENKDKINIIYKEGKPVDNPPKKKELKPSEIAGIVIGIVAFVAIVIVVVLILIKKKKDKEGSSAEASI